MPRRSSGEAVYALDRKRWSLVFLLYLVFVVYGSLVPLEWRDVPFDQALARFSNIGYLQLGALSRADWVANIVLYVPLAFLGCVSILGLRPLGLVSYLGALLILACCLAIAVGVEFTQIFFAPRTVSLNDLLAEAIGSGIGVLLWVFGRQRLFELGVAFVRGGRASVVAALVVFAIGYLVLSLFPFDFVVSVQELRERLGANANRWLFGSCDQWVRCLARWLGEVAAIAPIGLMLTLIFPRRHPMVWFWVGVGIGAVLEALQLLLYSGVSQVLSLPPRGIGLLLGSIVGQLLITRISTQTLAAWLRRALPFLAAPYLLLLFAVSGWFSGPWMTLDRGLARMAELGWVPFYYHYWTSEPIAMASLLSQLAMYAPVGLAAWASAAAFPRRRSSPWLPGLLAIALAIIVEGGKLFAPGARPDPSNLFIAPAGAWLVYWAAVWFARALTQGLEPVQARPMAPSRAVPPDNWRAQFQPSQDAVDARASPRSRAPAVSAGSRLLGLLPPLPPLPEPKIFGYLYLVGFGAAALVGLVLYPVGQVLLALALAIYAGLLWRFPWLWLAAIPAFLPTLDWSRSTGRVLLNELDLVVLMTLAIVGFRLSGLRSAGWQRLLLPLALALLWLSWALSMALGLAPARDEALAVSSSHTPLEAWFVGKGLLWALLLVPLLRRSRRLLGSALSARLFIHGILVALVWTCLVVLWERQVFVGLFDFDNEFRVTGPFASMNTGGAYIEVFLAFAFPMLLIWIFAVSGHWSKWLGALLVPLAGYAMLVTFSRGGYGGLLVGLLVLLFGLAAGRMLKSRRQWLLLGGLVLALGIAAVPVLTTGFAKQRLAQVAGDLRFRLGHWEHAVGMMGEGAAPMLFGAGFGRYPDLYLFSERAEVPPGTYKVVDQDGERLLSMGQGEAVYLDQRVAVRPDTRYRLSVRLRAASTGQAKLSLPLCEKALLYSFTCVWTTLSAKESEAGWQRLEADVQSGKVGRGGHWPHGPVVLSLYNSGTSVIDVDDVRLIAPDGRDLIANGGFDEGAERWLFVTDQDLAWHIHEQFVETYFAQGLLGLVALVLLLAAVVRVLWSGIRAGRLEAVAFAAALAGFLSVGLLGSTVDAARTAMLFYFGAFSAAILTRGGDMRRKGSRRKTRSGDAVGEREGVRTAEERQSSKV